MKQPVGTTFVAAIALLGAAALAQLLAILVFFAPRYEGGAVRPLTARSAAVPVATPPAPVEPVRSEAVAERDAADAKDRVDALLAEAAQAANPDVAQVALEEALTLDPRQPEVLSRLAVMEEQRGHAEIAADYWQRLAELGPDAGRLTDVAEIRLRILEAGAAGGPASDGGMRDDAGLQPGSSLGIVDVLVKDDDRGTGRPLKVLRIAVKARPHEEIDRRAVTINVSFYDKLEGAVVPTRSPVRSQWFTAPADWKDDGIEILEVSYEPGPSLAAGAPHPEFHGYMVQVYYRGDLQDMRAEPLDLLEQYPPPLRLEGPAS